MAAQTPRKPSGYARATPGRPAKPPTSKKPATPTKPRSRPPERAGVHKSVIKDISTPVIENELKRRNRIDVQKKAPRWTPAGGIAHKSRGGTK